MRSLTSALESRHDQEGAASSRPGGRGCRDGHARRPHAGRERGHAARSPSIPRSRPPTWPGWACTWSRPEHAFGLVVLVIFAFGRIAGNAGKPRPGPAPAGHRREAARGQSPASPGRSAAAGTPGPTRRDTAGIRTAAGPPRATPRGPTAGRGAARPPVLNPTNVYTPGGLIGAPRDGHAPDRPDGEPIPEILRTAEPGPGGFVPGRPCPGSAFPRRSCPGGALPRSARPGGALRWSARPGSARQDPIPREFRAREFPAREFPAMQGRAGRASRRARPGPAAAGRAGPPPRLPGYQPGYELAGSRASAVRPRRPPVPAPRSRAPPGGSATRPPEAGPR